MRDKRRLKCTSNLLACRRMLSAVRPASSVPQSNLRDDVMGFPTCRCWCSSCWSRHQERENIRDRIHICFTNHMYSFNRSYINGIEWEEIFDDWLMWNLLSCSHLLEVKCKRSIFLVVTEGSSPPPVLTRTRSAWKQQDWRDSFLIHAHLLTTRYH